MNVDLTSKGIKNILHRARPVDGAFRNAAALNRKNRNNKSARYDGDQRLSKKSDQRASQWSNKKPEGEQRKYPTMRHEQRFGATNGARARRNDRKLKQS